MRGISRKSFPPLSSILSPLFPVLLAQPGNKNRKRREHLERKSPKQCVKNIPNIFLEVIYSVGSMRAQLYKTQLKRTVLFPGRVGWVHVKISWRTSGSIFPHSFWYYWRCGDPIKYAGPWPVCVIEVMLVVLEESQQFMVALRQQSAPRIFHM